MTRVVWLKLTYATRAVVAFLLGIVVGLAKYPSLCLLFLLGAGSEGCLQTNG